MAAIDVDKTGVNKSSKLIAVHTVEFINNKLVRLFFHMFINKRKNKIEYMDYFSEYDYNVSKENKLKYFCRFL